MNLIYYSNITDDANRQAIKTSLEQEGYRVSCVNSPDIILNEIDNNPLENHAIFYSLSNDNIKECDEFLRTYKQKDKHGYGEIILIAEPQIRGEALVLMAKGASDVLSHPTDLDLVLAKLKRIGDMTHNSNSNAGDHVIDQLRMLKMQLMSVDAALKALSSTEDEKQLNMVIEKLNTCLIEIQNIESKFIEQSQLRTLSISRYIAKIFLDYGWGYEFGDPSMEKYQVAVDLKYFIAALNDLVEKLISIAKTPQNLSITYNASDKDITMTATVLEIDSLASIKLSGPNYFECVSKIISLSGGILKVDRMGQSSIAIKITMPIA